MRWAPRGPSGHLTCRRPSVLAVRPDRRSRRISASERWDPLGRGTLPEVLLPTGRPVPGLCFRHPAKDLGPSARRARCGDRNCGRGRGGTTSTSGDVTGAAPKASLRPSWPATTATASSRPGLREAAAQSASVLACPPAPNNDVVVTPGDEDAWLEDVRALTSSGSATIGRTGSTAPTLRTARSSPRRWTTWRPRP